MDAADGRRVDLAVRSRTIRLDTETGGAFLLSYPGIALLYHEQGQPVHEQWIPLGDHPRNTDDEALITALQHALQWAQPSSPPPIAAHATP
jgi:hypothetical protein